MSSSNRLHQDNPAAQVGWGQVRHHRLRPSAHLFQYPTFFLMLSMRALSTQTEPALKSAPSKHPLAALLRWRLQPWAINRFAPISFFDADHGDGRTADKGGALAWLEEMLHGHGIEDALGKIELHTYPRIFGFTFKPVSFWYCHRLDDSLRCILVEVNNTFGERHCYLLDAPHYGRTLVANKSFHVSPFCRVQGQYHFRFLRCEHKEHEHTIVRIELADESGPILRTSVSGALHPLNASNAWRTLWRYPAMTFMVIARIHWQALRLWVKGVPFFSKPNKPHQSITPSL